MKYFPTNLSPATPSGRFTVSGVTLAIVLFILFAILTSLRANERGVSYCSAELGSLVVYSATDEFNDGDVLYYAHGSYAIYTVDGRFVETVANHISSSDQVPERVMLPAGSYVIEARSEDKGYVRRAVMVHPQRITVLNLESR
jgi:hypothetical protein